MTPEVIKTLIEIANEQQRVMAAWRPSPVVPRKAILHTNPDLTLKERVFNMVPIAYGQTPSLQMTVQSFQIFKAAVNQSVVFDVPDGGFNLAF
mgnify:FL=1